ETLENVGEVDPETNAAMAAAAARWEDIEIHYRGTVMRSTGHRFSGVERKTLLELLARRARSLGAEIHWRQDIRQLTDCGLPAAVAYLEALFADELEGHSLVANRSMWRRFPTVRNARWHAGNVVLLGDAAHTAHFSVGSGTKLAMEDAIALAAALRADESVP